MIKRAIIAFALTLLVRHGTAASEEGIAMHGSPKYQAGFSHFSYADPAATQGGHLRLASVGSFDSLNPFIVRGNPAKGLGLIYQSLLNRSADEPFSLYSGLASIVDISSDRRRLHLRLHDKARFSDGTPVTATDVRFSFETLRDKGRPNHRQYYREVLTLEAPNDRDLIFTFREASGRELPLILGLMPVLSAKFYSQQPFAETHLSHPVGSGPYRIKTAEAGNQITYERIRPFWGDELRSMKGRHNFDQVTYKYFRDKEVAFQAFKANEVDLYTEGDPAKWNARKKDTTYRSVALSRRLPPYMEALVFNTRRAPFDDKNIRKALARLFDFEWINKNLLHGLYQRTGSFFEHTPLSALNPLSTTEQETLKILGIKSDDYELLDQQAFATNLDRRNSLRAAKKILREAGWKIGPDGMLIDRNKKAFEFEILLVDRQYQKILAGFIDTLRKIGIQAKIRMMDSAGYQQRINQFDFDMMIARWGQSLSPGNEQAFYWGSAAADLSGSRNYPGIRSAAVDEMIQKIKASITKEELQTATRVLDRLLLAGHYVIPLYHRNSVWVYHHKHLTYPTTLPDRGLSTDLWSMRPIDE
ncbi:ABC transporter substrate-binding protein [Sneathiella sp. P13V-1]|uniref:extracellular solute-binding protein n=1 Tax=Sneathiella sp. P13V-1 TaxID=2697366 RepID=UPI00187B2F03|nr:extracellular solute-binding protein [Sneathiella sp. P13V-1]MBE7635703.1 ABC transporter substrate-binding protein [Sneathiella sp. P13V-1]